MTDAERLLREARDAKSCENCPNQGWWADRDRNTGDAVQVQCEFCETEPQSVFNVQKRIDTYLSTLPRNGLDAATVEACAKVCDAKWDDLKMAGGSANTFGAGAVRGSAGAARQLAVAIRALVAEPAAPRLSRCSKHGGYGFVSDCTVCNEPATAAT